MKIYIGTKVINAKPMNRADYNVLRGWTLPSDENGLDEGYLVEYTDGGKANTNEYKGYVSWSLKVNFENAYSETQGLTFGLAVEAIKNGSKLSRQDWNKGMFVFLVAGSEFTVNRAPLLGIYTEGTQITYQPHMDLCTEDGSIATWSPSGSDALAEDWVIVE